MYLVFLYTWDGVLRESLELTKGRYSIIMFDGECRMALETMLWNQASSGVDLGYTEHFCVAAVTSGSL